MSSSASTTPRQRHPVPPPLASPIGASASAASTSQAGGRNSKATEQAKAGVAVPSAAGAAAELDLTGIDQDLARFHQDELVRQALGRGVELKGYAAQIEQELKEVCACSVYAVGEVWNDGADGLVRSVGRAGVKGGRRSRSLDSRTLAHPSTRNRINHPWDRSHRWRWSR